MKWSFFGGLKGYINSSVWLRVILMMFLDEKLESIVFFFYYLMLEVTEIIVICVLVF